MWGNPRLLNQAAAVAAWAAVALALYGGVELLRSSSLFPVKEVQLAGRPQATSGAEIEAAVRPLVGGNFFALDLPALRAALERLPWVRRASVRRVWPDRVEIALEEHVALARWGGEGEMGALLNTFGERFVARTDAKLPLLAGPVGTQGEVARRYLRFAEIVAPLGRADRVVLSQRYAWQLRLDSGLVVMLGRDADQAEERLRRFVRVYALAKGAGQKPEYADLRYPNGFALRVPGARS